jgi:acyl-coenzyme A thioesterase PaaI-like protein
MVSPEGLAPQPSATEVPFFELENGAHAPYPIARSPWREGYQNGLAIGGLLAHTLLEAELPEGMDLARFTMDILRPAPMAPTHARWRTVREGRRTGVLEGVLTIGGADVARATALFVRRSDHGAPPTPYGPPDMPPEAAPREYMLPKGMGLESRLIGKGVPNTAQPVGRVWVRQDTPIVGGGACHPLIAAVQAADFAGSLASGIDREAWTSPNIDIAVHFLRQPRDEWVLVEATALAPGNGSTLVETQLSDRSGLFAHAHVTLVVSPSDPARKVAWP